MVPLPNLCLQPVCSCAVYWPSKWLLWLNLVKSKMWVLCFYLLKTCSNAWISMLKLPPPFLIWRICYSTSEFWKTYFSYDPNFEVKYSHKHVCSWSFSILSKSFLDLIPFWKNVPKRWEDWKTAILQNILIVNLQSCSQRVFKFE